MLSRCDELLLVQIHLLIFTRATLC